jgi:hypothetical protein
MNKLLLLAAFLVFVFSASGSSCVVVQAAEIASVEISRADPEPWQDIGNLERQRKVTLRLFVKCVLKGSLHAGDNVTVVVTQNEARGRYFAVTGAWSGKAVDSGRHYLIFAKNTSMQDESLLRVTDEKNASSDVELALAFEEKGWPLSELAKRVGRRRGSLGPLFAEYLKARLPQVVQRKAGDWEAVLRFIESADLPASFRSLASDAAIEALLQNSPAPETQLMRTIIGAFRLLALPDANGLQNRLLQAQLPNLLGWEGSEPKRSAQEVFRHFPKDRVASEKALRQLAPSPERDRLLEWIQR